ncbi:hypothetical protein [Pseudoduganella violacea]|uniref:Apea-like HEPN domain-containing protein n=1 Tax=Pseudoduganella violacea TaxID=1715466 RepID=A0A7W5FXM9_9BURK|nr:hypothetical protein [Pseudoduganella violacea]MBB3122453.1 hypothetical protein [Pseudoduganella violacea]
MITDRGSLDKNNNKLREVIYYLPFIEIESEISGKNFVLKKYDVEHKRKNLMPSGIFDSGGCVLEAKWFVSGDYFDQAIDYETHQLIEKLRFSYFFTNPSTPASLTGYISSENFECFRLIQKNTDESYEHKVTLTNGMYYFMHSLEKYYAFRSILNPHKAIVRHNDLRYVDRFPSISSDSDLFSAIKLYNKCWETYAIHDYADKALLARASTEASLRHANLSLKSFIDIFWEKSINHISFHAKNNIFIDNIFKTIKQNLSTIKSNLESQIEGLRAARHKIAHGDDKTRDYINVPFYLVWFPNFWISTLENDSLRSDEALRLALFITLLKCDVRTWLVSHLSKRSPIDAYANFSRTLPQHLSKDDAEITKIAMVSLENWIKSL